MDIINPKVLGRHSAYSRYSSQKRHVDPGSWSYTIQPGYFPTFPSTTFRILSMNLQRYPMSYYSPIVVESVIRSALPHVIFIQELSRSSSIPELVELINRAQSTRSYNYIFGIDTVRNLQLTVIFDTTTISLSSFDHLFRDYAAEKESFNRPVLFLSCEFTDFDVKFYNLHLPSNRKIGASDMRINCFGLLDDYFDSLDSDTLYLLGGDWNVATSSTLFSTYLSNFTSVFSGYSSNSDLIIHNTNAEGNIIYSSPNQCLWNIITYNQISVADWNTYVSDHRPIICDYKIY